MPALISTATVAAVGLACKTFLYSGYCGAVTVTGLSHLVEALHDEERNRGQGIITVSNHISTLDDPTTWGILPAKFYFDPRMTRWALGASEIMFTNPIFSEFFRLGQTLETFRGKGIYQPAMDTVIEKLDKGDWVHLYGEGKIHQPDQYPQDPVTLARKLPRFKWGVGRILMETRKQPTVIPMWLTGFNDLMPEGRPFPFKYFPKPGAKLGITFGKPIDPMLIQSTLKRKLDARLGKNEPAKAANMLLASRITPVDAGILARSPYPHLIAMRAASPATTQRLISTTTQAQDSKSQPQPTHQCSPSEEERLETIAVRTKVTAIIHDAVETLGKEVLGDTLGGGSGAA